MPHGVVANIGDGGVEHQYFRLFRYVGVDRVNVQVAKMRGETRLLLRFDWLVAKEQHLMFKQSLLDGLAMFRAQRLADIDPTDLRAEGCAQGSNGRAVHRRVLGLGAEWSA